jgi:hypothetical protein
VHRHSITAIAAIALILASCQSARNDAVSHRVSGADVSEELYQPTDHALLVIEGGAGTVRSAEPLVTRWRNEGTGQTFELRLVPGTPQVRPIKPGRYQLASAASDVGDFYPRSDASPRVGELLLDPGEVVYAGKLLMREDHATASTLIIEVKSDPARASAAVAAAHPDQASLLQTRLLTVIK